MTEKLIPHLTLVGVGLIGGSFALALKEAGVVGRVTGVGRSQANLDVALARGVIDDATTDPVAGVRTADVVMLAVPVQSMVSVARQVLPAMKPGAILTDGGSVKGAVVEAVEPLVPPGVHFVPGHPIAGTERSGAGAAFANLYRGRRCILTPTARTDAAALDLVTRAWQAAGSEVVCMPVEKHDRILAAISHLPHMVAYALVNAVGSYDRYPENILEYSAGGFRDFTRIASSDPIMWRDIAMSNRDALLEMIDRYQAFLSTLRDDVAQGRGEALYEAFCQSKRMRDALLDQRQSEEP